MLEGDDGALPLLAPVLPCHLQRTFICLCAAIAEENLFRTRKLVKHLCGMHRAAVVIEIGCVQHPAVYYGKESFLLILIAVSEGIHCDSCYEIKVFLAIFIRNGNTFAASDRNRKL